MIQNDVFDPVSYSLEECQFLIKYLGQPPISALKDFPTGPGMTPVAVRDALERVYELIELERHRGTAWVGVEELKKRLSVYLEQHAKWTDDHARHSKAPAFPSLYSYDGKGRPHRGGPDSDSGRVKTYFDAEGNRKEFAVHLFDNIDRNEWRPEWMQAKVAAAPSTKKLFNDVENRRIECPICKHTESYKAESASSERAARARMSKHLVRDTKEVSLHRELYTNEFGS
jgi:predicted nucleic-acid-binding Zn-ribbon protein